MDDINCNNQIVRMLAMMRRNSTFEWYLDNLSLALAKNSADISVNVYCAHGAVKDCPDWPEAKRKD